MYLMCLCLSAQFYFLGLEVETTYHIPLFLHYKMELVFDNVVRHLQLTFENWDTYPDLLFDIVCYVWIQGDF